jgi:hypothetical protein
MKGVTTITVNCRTPELDAAIRLYAETPQTTQREPSYKYRARREDSRYYPRPNRARAEIFYKEPKNKKEREERHKIHEMMMDNTWIPFLDKETGGQVTRQEHKRRNVITLSGY